MLSPCSCSVNEVINTAVTSAFFAHAPDRLESIIELLEGCHGSDADDPEMLALFSHVSDSE